MVNLATLLAKAGISAISTTNGLETTIEVKTEIYVPVRMKAKANDGSRLS
jgi:hypothetical protein